MWQRWGWRQKWRQCRRCHHTDKEGSKTDGAVCWVKPQDATAPPSTPSHQISRFKKESIPEPPTSSPMSVCFLLLDSELIFSARCVVLDMIQWLFEIGQRQIEALKKKTEGIWMIKTSAAARVLSANIGSPRKQVNSGSSARLSLSRWNTVCAWACSGWGTST